MVRYRQHYFYLYCCLLFPHSVYFFWGGGFSFGLGAVLCYPFVIPLIYALKHSVEFRQPERWRAVPERFNFHSLRTSFWCLSLHGVRRDVSSRPRSFHRLFINRKSTASRLWRELTFCRPGEKSNWISMAVKRVGVHRIYLNFYSIVMPF